MKHENIKKLKKYLFYISIFFCSVSFLHLSYSYVAENSESKPVIGGSITEGIVGNFPSLNPLAPLSGNNEYITNLLYRSLLRYDIEQGKIVGDIARCDISTLVNIECVINDDALWSNGNKITADDIVATYNIIKETNANPAIVSLLDGVTIDAGDNVVVFKNTKKDINFLNIFFQPILSEEIINKLSSANISGNFPYSNGVYSGEYVIRDVTTDENMGVSKIIFEKNEFFGDANIKKITMYVFPDANALERNKQAVTVFNDENTILGDSVSRLKSHKYALSQFVSLFINTEKQEHKNLRATILEAIERDNLVKLLGENNNAPVINPYFGEDTIDTAPANTNFDAVMNSIGYRKKSQLIEALKSSDKNTENQNEANEDTDKQDEETTTPTIPEREEVTLARYQKDSEFITEPEYVDYFNFITKDDVLLTGIGTKDIVDEVYINDYKLEGFTAGDENFNYRLSEGLGTLKPGENIYKIYFVANGEKLLKEEIHFFYGPKESHEAAETALVDRLYKEEQATLAPEQEANEPIETPKEEIDTTELEKLKALDDKMYYSRDLQPYTLKLVYVNTRDDFQKTAEFIQKSLKEIGLQVELNGLSTKEFAKAILNDDYDLVLGGIDTGYFSFNIFPYFHSSQVENGFNYGNIRRTSLDLLLEELRENIYNPEITLEKQQAVLKLLTEEQFVKTLYSPKYDLLIDKSINSNLDFSKLPDAALRSEAIEKLYMNQTTNLSLKGKSIGGFIGYLGKKLYE